MNSIQRGFLATKDYTKIRINSQDVKEARICISRAFGVSTGWKFEENKEGMFLNPDIYYKEENE